MANFNNGKNIAVVIQCQKEKGVLARLDKKAPSLFGRGRYAYILHDKDKLDKGGMKGPHIHLVLCAEVGMSSANWVKHFADGLNLEPSAISVQMQGSEKKCLRYLLHLDDGAKHQYDRSEVITNMDETCKKAWESSSAFISNPPLEQLEGAYKAGPRALYDLVGMQNFAKAQKVCETIIHADTQYEELFDMVQSLRETLATFTANPQYLEKGYIPFRDFQAALYAVDGTLEEMTRFKLKTLELKEKNKQ